MSPSVSGICRGRDIDRFEAGFSLSVNWFDQIAPFFCAGQVDGFMETYQFAQNSNGNWANF